MRKNAGISTVMVTGMAAFVSIFAMVLLIVLRSTIYGGSEDSKAIAEAKAQGASVDNQFKMDVQNAGINVYWDKVNIACVCVEDDIFSVTWFEVARKAVYRAAMRYPLDNLTSEEKAELAQKCAKFIIQNPEEVKEEEDKPLLDACKAAKSSQQTLATGIRAYAVDTGLDNEAVLTLKIEYTDSKNEVQILDQEYTQAYSGTALTFRASQK